MIKTNNFLIKLLVSILIVLTIFNFVSSTNIKMNYCFASEESESGEEKTGGLISGILSGIGNAIMNAIKSIPVAIARGMRSINYSLAASAGVNYEGGTDVHEASPFDIFFNRFALLDANIFSTTYRGTTTQIPEDSVVYKIRTNTAMWYYGIRTLAILFITVMLFVNIFKALYGGSSAEQKTKAKNSITDWVLSFALVMFMHIIVIVVLNLNDLVLSAIEAFMGENTANTKNFFDALENAVFSSNLILSIAALVVYFMLNWQVFKYILKYIQRLLTIVLLVMIAPIIPVSYSLDRMKHGKNGGSSLNNWLKELVFNVFIQSLHALIYAALVGVAMSALTDTSSVTALGSLSNALVAICAMLFIKHAEALLKSILGFDKSQVLNSNVFSEAASTVRNVSNSLRSKINPAVPGTGVQFGQNVGNGANGGGINNLFGRPAAGGNVQPGGIRQNTGTFFNGMRNVLTGQSPAAGADGAIDVTNGQDGRDGRDGEAIAEARAEATATAEIEGQDGENENGAPVIISGGDADAQDKQKTTDMLQDEKVEDLQKDVDENLTEEEKKKRELDNMVKELVSTQTTKKETTEEHTETEEITEESEESEEVIGEGGLDDESLNRIVDKLKEQITPELLDKVTEVLNDEIKPELLDAIKAITEGDNEKIAEIRADLNAELSEQMNNIGWEKAGEIEGEVDSKVNNPEELQKYISSLPENSSERAYAETYAKLSTMDSVYNDNNMSTEEKVESIVGLNGALNVKNANLNGNGEENVKPSGTSNVKESENNANDMKTAGNVRTMQAVNGAMEMGTANSDEIQEPDIEVKPDPDIDNLKNGPVKEMMVELSEIDPVKYRVHGKAENEITEEIQSDFEANIEYFTEKMGRAPEGLNDIYKNMDREAQTQFAQYSRQEIDPKELKGDAKGLATLQIQASRLGFAMQAENEYKYTINQGEVRTSSTTQGVISDLTKYRDQRQQEIEQRRNNRGKHSA